MGAAEIDIPPNALSGNATVSITRENTPSALTPGSAPNVFQFDIGQAALRKGVRLYLPAPTSLSRGGTEVLAYRNGNGAWAAVPASFEHGRLMAAVTHLSLWGSLDLGAWIGGHADLLTGVARLLGLRAAPPNCSQGRGQASLVYPAADRLAQPPILACISARSDGDVLLRITNNRSYAMAIDSTNLDPQKVSILDSGSLEHAVAVVYSQNGSTILPPGGSAEYLLSLSLASGSITYRPAPLATLAMFDLALLADLTDKQLASAKAVTIVDCARRIGNDPAAIRFGLAQCIVDVIKQNVDLARLGIIKKLGVGLIAPVVAYIVASLDLAPRVLDAWADLALFNAASDRLTVAHVLPRTVAGPMPRREVTHGTPGNPTTSQAPGLPPRRQAPTQAPEPARSQVVTPTPTPPRQPIVHYSCANDNSNIGKYVPPGHYWQNDFMARGATITDGWVLIGANNDGSDHRAIVGIYGSVGLSTPLAQTEVSVSGYDGENFALPQPLNVTIGQQLYLTVVGIGDFTAYDSSAGCFIGTVVGYG